MSTAPPSSTPSPSPSPSPSSVGVSDSSFGVAYSQRLQSLLTTDRSAINSLTILADEHRDKMTEVVRCIEDRLRAIDTGDARLPILYLIDSLCQNLGRKGVRYPKLFDPIIGKIMASTVKRASTKVRSGTHTHIQKRVNRRSFAMLTRVTPSHFRLKPYSRRSVTNGEPSLLCCHLCNLLFWLYARRTLSYRHHYQTFQHIVTFCL